MSSNRGRGADRSAKTSHEHKPATQQKPDETGVNSARRAIEHVRSESGYAAHYARRFGGQVVYLETRESRNSTMLVYRVGRTLPAYATALGKALLAELMDSEIEELLPETFEALTEHTITDRAALLEECAQIRLAHAGSSLRHSHAQPHLQRGRHSE